MQNTLQNPAVKEVYRLVLDKCYRMNLIKDEASIQAILHTDAEESDLDNKISQLLLPAINKLLDKSLFDMYQVLYTIDVQEDFIKEKIMDLQNTSMIPSIIAFAIIDRLKTRYQNYPLLNNPSTSS
jgi:hypothetical protein